MNWRGLDFAILVASFASVLNLRAAAGAIDSISPTCAAVGAKVTITGNGFGARNVDVAVGGVPAPLFSATGNTAVFVVPPGVSLGPTTVTATNPGGQMGSIAFKVCDLVVPDAWAGQWQITTTFRNAATGSVTATYPVTTFIRTGEPFGLSTVVQRGSCTGTASGTHFAVQCAGLGTVFTCSIGSNVQLTIDRSGDTITGSGIDTRTVSGACAPLGNANQTVSISGQRLSLNQDPSGPPTSLVKTFVPFAGLLTGTP